MFFRFFLAVVLVVAPTLAQAQQTVRPTVAIVGLNPDVASYTYGKAHMWASQGYEVVEGQAAEGAEYEIRVFDARTFQSNWNVPSVNIPGYGSAGGNIENTRFRCLLAFRHRPSGRVLLQTTDGPGGGETTGWGGSGQSHGYFVAVNGYSSTATGAVDDFFRQLRCPAPLAGSGQVRFVASPDGRRIVIFGPSGSMITIRSWNLGPNGRGSLRGEKQFPLQGGTDFVHNPHGSTIEVELTGVGGSTHWEGRLLPNQ